MEKKGEKKRKREQNNDLLDMGSWLILECMQCSLLLSTLSLWAHGHDKPPPSGTAAFSQKTWDTAVVSFTAESLLERVPDGVSRAALLAVSTKESGAWLHALPISNLGLRMDDNMVRAVMGLGLGSSTLCHPHTCKHCDANVRETRPTGYPQPQL